MEKNDLRMMIADYMERGFLENIIDMFRHDTTLYPLIGELMADERMRVRLGVAALAEALTQERPGDMAAAVPGIAPLLNNENPTLRGDAAHLLGIIGSRDALPHLVRSLEDTHTGVLVLVREAIEEIEQGGAWHNT